MKISLLYLQRKLRAHGRYFDLGHAPLLYIHTYYIRSYKKVGEERLLCEREREKSLIRGHAGYIGNK